MMRYMKLADTTLAKDVNITFVSEEGRSFSFQAGDKLEKGEFKLISDNVYEKWVSANQENVISQIRRPDWGMKSKWPEMKNVPVKPNSPSVIQLGEQFMPQSPSVEISHRRTKSKIIRQSEKEPLVGELVLDKSLEGKKALAFVD